MPPSLVFAAKLFFLKKKYKFLKPLRRSLWRLSSAASQIAARPSAHPAAASITRIALSAVAGAISASAASTLVTAATTPSRTIRALARLTPAIPARWKESDVAVKDLRRKIRSVGIRDFEFEAASLLSILGSARRNPGSVSHRTLMDIIKEEHDTNGGADAGINWKSLKERLRLRRARSGAAWVTPSAHSCPISDPEVVVSVRPNPAATLGRSISRAASVRYAEIPLRGSASRRGAIVSEYKPPAAARGTEEEEKLDSPASGSNAGGAEEGEGCEASNRAGGGEAEAAAAGEQPVRISLMALLEQTDRWVGEGEGEAAAEEEEEEVAEDDDDEGGDGGGMYHVCCVCMVRHKGAAFIPCGHTFCRLCSRELWVSRGNCPLCNGFILEILDIF